MTEKRIPTAIDRIAEQWVDTLCELDPDFRIWLGRDGDVTEFADYSPTGHAAYDTAVRSTLNALRSADAVDDVDRVTKLDLTGDLELALELSDSQWHLRDLNNIASPAQGIRDVFDLMPTDGVEAWETIASKLGNVSSALNGYRQTLTEGMRQGFVPARRQIIEVIAQAERHAAPEGFFIDFATNSAPSDLPESLRSDLRTAAESARLSYLEFATFLRDDLASASHEHDGVGREVYGLHSRHFLGATVDLDETYEWGIDELARMRSEQETIAKRISGGSVADAVAALLVLVLLDLVRRRATAATAACGRVGSEYGLVGGGGGQAL
jgi:uncharacterized protein (DUF885 family)